MTWAANKELFLSSTPACWGPRLHSPHPWRAPGQMNRPNSVPTISMSGCSGHGSLAQLPELCWRSQTKIYVCSFVFSDLWQLCQTFKKSPTPLFFFPFSLSLRIIPEWWVQSLMLSAWIILPTWQHQQIWGEVGIMNGLCKLGPGDGAWKIIDVFFSFPRKQRYDFSWRVLCPVFPATCKVRSFFCRFKTQLVFSSWACITVTTFCNFRA